jgi:hypothetical protein
MTRVPFILLASAILAPLLGTSTFLEAAEIPNDWTIDNVRRSESTTGAEFLEIRNLHGDLRVRPVDEEEISLSAMIQRHADDPRHPEIRTSSEGSVFRVEVLYPEAEHAEPTPLPDAWSKRRVDMTLFVPAKRPLTVETARGLIEVKGLDRGITARSASGDIVVSTAGPVNAMTEHGSIAAQFSDTTWETPIELETLTGAISVTLPQTADTSVTMTTSGDFTTDFSLTVERQPGSERKTAQATIAGGKSKLFMTSNRGSLKLLRSPF